MFCNIRTLIHSLNVPCSFPSLIRITTVRLFPFFFYLTINPLSVGVVNPLRTYVLLYAFTNPFCNVRVSSFHIAFRLVPVIIKLTLSLSISNTSFTSPFKKTKYIRRPYRNNLITYPTQRTQLLYFCLTRVIQPPKKI